MRVRVEWTVTEEHSAWVDIGDEFHGCNDSALAEVAEKKTLRVLEADSYQRTVERSVCKVIEVAEDEEN